jgi:hypothetical protein
VPAVTTVLDGGERDEGQDGRGAGEVRENPESPMAPGTPESDVARVTAGRPPAAALGSPREEMPGELREAAPEDRPWTPIPRPARPLERGLIPGQRRLKKTSRSA